MKCGRCHVRIGNDMQAAGRCGGCLRIAYCTSACQESHWPVHAPECTPSHNASIGTDMRGDARIGIPLDWEHGDHVYYALCALEVIRRSAAYNMHTEFGHACLRAVFVLMTWGTYGAASWLNEVGIVERDANTRLSRLYMDMYTDIEKNRMGETISTMPYGREFLLGYERTVASGGARDADIDNWVAQMKRSKRSPSQMLADESYEYWSSLARKYDRQGLLGEQKLYGDELARAGVNLWLVSHGYNQQSTP